MDATEILEHRGQDGAYYRQNKSGVSTFIVNIFISVKSALGSGKEGSDAAVYKNIVAFITYLVRTMILKLNVTRCKTQCSRTHHIPLRQRFEGTCRP